MAQNADTWHFFSRPWLAALALAWTVGVLDAYSFQVYGVFTSNQGGNLIVLGNALATDPLRAGLAGLSLLGAALGVGASTAIQRWLATSRWLRIAVPLVLMIVLIMVASFIRHVLHGSPAVLVPITSAALAGLATALLKTPAVHGWLTANTGAFLTCIHHVVEGRSARAKEVGQPLMAAAMVTLGFVAGAVAWGSGILGDDDPSLPALVPTLVALTVAFVSEARARRGTVN